MMESQPCRKWRAARHRAGDDFDGWSQNVATSVAGALNAGEADTAADNDRAAAGAGVQAGAGLQDSLGMMQTGQEQETTDDGQATSG